MSCGVILVAGALANKYRNGGEAWVRLSWVLGLLRLRFQVYFLEQITPAACQNVAGNEAAFGDSMNLAWFRSVTDSFGIAERAALIYGAGEQCAGMSWEELQTLAGRAELLINVSGHLTLEPLLKRVRRKVYVDIDPGFTQFWHADPNMAFKVAGHDYYFTIGENIGTPVCGIPTGGIAWRPIRQPVVLDQWPVVRSPLDFIPSGPGTPGGKGRGEGGQDSSRNREFSAGSAPSPPTPPPRSTGLEGSLSSTARFTTVANWRGPFGPVQIGGKIFGLKVHEFRKIIELPRRAGSIFEIALDIHPADQKDREALERHGWRLVDPSTVAGDPAAFRDYIQGSAAEFSAAQGIYVDTNSGWFSDRSVRYLASGKPVLVQDTGFGRNIPVGEGIVPFRTLDEAVAGAEDIVRNYDRHCQAARRLAEEHFDSDKVLRRFLADIGIVA